MVGAAHFLFFAEKQILMIFVLVAIFSTKGKKVIICIKVCKGTERTG